MDITAYQLAQRFIGIEEVPGKASSAQILAMLKLDNVWPEDDEVPWCSAFVNYVCWLLRLPRSKSLMARSWLEVGFPIELKQARPAFDVVILKRGTGEQPGPEVIDAPGHVGFYSGHDVDNVMLLSGNQSDSVNIQYFDIARVLGVRRLL